MDKEKIFELFEETGIQIRAAWNFGIARDNETHALLSIDAAIKLLYKASEEIKKS